MSTADLILAGGSPGGSMNRIVRTALVAIATTLGGLAPILWAGHGNAQDAKAGGLKIDATSFRCIRKMTPVRQFYVDNLLGHRAATLEVANSKTGGVYPPGSVIQLIPGEAMVKREKGFNPATRDSEFFEIEVMKPGTQKRKRRVAERVNRYRPYRL